MEILLIRHGKTRGNLEGRYIGRTDEPLLKESGDVLQQSPYREFEPDVIYVSPMRRCRETAEILFGGGYAGAVRDASLNNSVRDIASSNSRPVKKQMGDDMLSDSYKSQRIIIYKDLREMDFGAFENKNYEDLKDEPVYQAWIDAGGHFAFPGGENPADFRMRCRKAFENDIKDASRKGCRKVAFVVHGGTIMSIMEAYGTPKGDFYRWQVKNGEGYHCIAVKAGETISLREKA